MKKIFISGASSGIGKSLAKSYSKKGYVIGLCSRNIEKLRLVKTEIENLGGKIFIYQLDVQNSVQCNIVAKQFMKNADGVDYVIANAGIGGEDDLFSGKSDNLNNILKTNLFGVTNILMPFIPTMKKQKSGKLICISSVAAYIPTPHHGGYSGSKIAIKMIIDSWRPTLNSFNIKAITICPGFIDTPMVKGVGRRFPLKSSDEASEKFLNIIEKNQETFIYPRYYKLIIYFYRLIPDRLYKLLITKIISKPIS